MGRSWQIPSGFHCILHVFEFKELWIFVMPAFHVVAWLLFTGMWGQWESRAQKRGQGTKSLADTWSPLVNVEKEYKVSIRDIVGLDCRITWLYLVLVSTLFHGNLISLFYWKCQGELNIINSHRVFLSILLSYTLGRVLNFILTI